MPNTLLEYQLRIRNASTVANPNGTADALTITSVSTGTNPYIAAPPSGDGQELDPVTGAVRTGAYVVEVADAATGTDGTGTIRVVTNALEDAAALQQLLGRRAFVEYRANGGAWQPLQTGYILNVRLVSPVRWAITVGDTRRVERTQPIFSGASLGSYATRGCLTGGPVTADFGPVKARGGWEYRLYNAGGPNWFADFVQGYLPTANSTPTRDWRTLQNPNVPALIAGFARVNPYALLGGGSNYVTAFGELNQAGTAVTDGITVYAGTSPTATALQSALLVSTSTPSAETLGYARLNFYWPSCPFGNGSTVYLSLSTAKVSEPCPLYIDAHPVDIVTAIWSANRIQYDTGGAWIASLKALIGLEVRLALRMTEVPVIEQFLQDAILGPFGLAIRTTTAGNQELVSTRIATTATPSLTIAAADLASADPVVFELDERTAISSVTLTQKVLAPAVLQYNMAQANVNTDGLQVSEVSITANYGNDPTFTTFAARDVAFTVPGMIHTAADFTPTPALTLDAIAKTMVPRFGRGVAAAEVQVLASAASAAAQVGDEVYLAAPHYPNRNYRIGESTVGARIMQVVRRTDTPTGLLLRLLDSGLAAQPVSPAATITAAKNPSNPTLVARFTITNAGTINAGNTIGVEVEWATGASAPTGNGTTFAIYEPGDVPTAAVDLPGLLASGQTVHVRARTTQFQRRPSAWTAWQSVTLDTIPTPGAITATAVSATATDIAWANTSNDYPIAVFAFLGGSAPANWAPYFVGELPAGSTATTIRTLSAGTWQLAIAYDAAGSFGPFRTGSVTTTGSGAAATRPAGLAAIDLLDDVSLRQGVALGLFPSDQTLDIVVERAFLLAGPYVEVGRVNGATESIVDILPRDGQTYFYRTRHALGGYATSAATPVVSAVARGVPPTVNRPPARVPTVQVGVSETTTTGTVSLAISDTQGRFVQARFRHRTNGGAWSAWTVATATPTTNPSGTINGYTASYAASLPATGFLDIEYEVTAFGADGVVAVIAGGVESFDVGVSADFVSVVGSFGVNGNFILTLSADTDTASFKFATSTISQPTLATTQAQGAINGRNYTTTFAGPYDIGTVIYVSALGYTGAGGTGSESVLFEYQFTRGAANIQCVAQETTSTNTASTVTVSALNAAGGAISGAEVQLVSLSGPAGGAASISSGAAIGVWVSAPAVWVFNRGAPLSGSSDAVFRVRRSATNTNETDDDVFVITEEGIDTRPLVVRARELSTSTATNMVVRVAVNVPAAAVTGVSASLGYNSQGISSITPASPQTVTTGVGNFTIPETAGSFVDFTIARPGLGQPAGRVTFTATASGFTTDADQVDVAPQTKDFTPPTFSPTLTLTATTGQVTWPAVAAGVTVEGSTDNVTFTTATGTTYPAAATSRNAFGGATKFLFVRAYNAAGVYTPTYSFAVPPQDPAVPVITKVTAYTLTLNYSTDPTDPNTFQLDYTISNFPSGGSIEVSVLQDGVDIGIPVISSSSSTQTIVASPIVLNATGTTPVRWDIMFRVMDSTGINVEATSKVLDATSYV